MAVNVCKCPSVSVNVRNISTRHHLSRDPGPREVGSDSKQEVRGQQSHAFGSRQNNIPNLTLCMLRSAY